MRFGLLGPLAVWTADGTPVTVPDAKVRLLLAALLAHEGHPVSVDRLLECLWADRPPANPTGALQTKVWRLRRALNAATPGARDRVVSHPPGYLLRTGPEPTDVERFTALLEQAANTATAHTRAALLDEALGLVACTPSRSTWRAPSATPGRRRWRWRGWPAWQPSTAAPRRRLGYSARRRWRVTR